MTSEGALRIGQAAFKPITWSPADTPVTVRQIKVHNEVGVELGLWKAPPMRKAVKKKPKIAAVKPKSEPVVVAPTPEPDVVPLPPPAPPKKKWWQR